jgi:hypothetical protein
VRQGYERPIPGALTLRVRHPTGFLADGYVTTSNWPSSVEAYISGESGVTDRALARMNRAHVPVNDLKIVKVVIVGLSVVIFDEENRLWRPGNVDFDMQGLMRLLLARAYPIRFG